jgi:hypothetical protein
MRLVCLLRIDYSKIFYEITVIEIKTHRKYWTFFQVVNLFPPVMNREASALCCEIPEPTEYNHHLDGPLTIHFCSITFMFKHSSSMWYFL